MIYIRKRYTHRGDIHIKRIRRGYKGDTEGTQRRHIHREDIDTEETYTWRKQTHKEDIHIKKTYIRKRHRGDIHKERCIYGKNIYIEETYT